MPSAKFIRAASANLHRALQATKPAPDVATNLARAMQRRIVSQHSAQFEIALPTAPAAVDVGLKGGLHHAKTAVNGGVSTRAGPTLVRWHSLLF